MCMRCGYVTCEHCFNPMVDVMKQLPSLPKGPPLVNDEPEVGHTFTKKDYQDYASCDDCGMRVRFRDNASDAVQQMQAHECAVSPDNGGGL